MTRVQKQRLSRRRAHVARLAKTTVVKKATRGKTARAAVIAVTDKAFNSANDIRKVLARRFGIHVSTSTVTRDLHHQGFKCKSRPRGPMHTTTDPQARLKFARKMSRCQPSQLHKIIFSDECMATGNQRARKDWTQDRALRRGVDQNTPKVMFWCCIGVNFRVALPFSGRLSGVDYQEVLSKEVPRLRANQRVLQYDNASAHTAKSTLEWYAQSGIRTLNSAFGTSWPPRSPDLSPIETLFAIVQTKTANRNPLTEKELRKLWLEEFYKVPQATINKLVKSFPDRLRACTKLKGDLIDTKSL
jgi:transposase InsO family protein